MGIREVHSGTTGLVQPAQVSPSGGRFEEDGREYVELVELQLPELQHPELQLPDLQLFICLSVYLHWLRGVRSFGQDPSPGCTQPLPQHLGRPATGGFCSCQAKLATLCLGQTESAILWPNQTTMPDKVCHALAQSGKACVCVCMLPANVHDVSKWSTRRGTMQLQSPESYSSWGLVKVHGLWPGRVDGPWGKSLGLGPQQVHGA